MRRTMSQGPIG
uniref:Uncharacterized protein n=1 Tax=Anguilla anguilla TaxID=7936 RepID=A0A0E9T1L0_ANGAN